jgi:hypothetical protein
MAGKFIKESRLCGKILKIWVNSSPLGVIIFLEDFHDG